MGRSSASASRGAGSCSARAPPVSARATTGRPPRLSRTSTSKAWSSSSSSVADERGEAVEDALQAELEEGVDVEVVLLGDDPFEVREPGRRQDPAQGRFLGVHPLLGGQARDSPVLRLGRDGARVSSPLCELGYVGGERRRQVVSVAGQGGEHPL